MYTSKILLLVFIGISIWLSLINAGRLISKESVPAINIIIQTIGIVGVIAYYL